MNQITHEEAFAELAAVALDAVPPDLAQAVRAHAAVCPECGPELAAMEETAATLGELVPAAQMNRGRAAGIRSRLVMRARSERELQSAPVPGPPDITRGVASLTGLGHKATPGAQRVVSGESRRVTPTRPAVAPDITPARRGTNWLAIAATIAFVATAAQLLRVTADRNAMRAQLARGDTVTVAAVPSSDSLSAALAQREAIIAAMSGSDVRTVSLSSDSVRQPMARMMWNRASDDWVMVTYNLRPPKPGMTYQVWLVTDTEKISAGTFRPDSQGKAMMHAHYALARNALRAVAVTEEPEGGMPAPTGPIVIAGS